MPNDTRPEGLLDFPIQDLSGRWHERPRQGPGILRLYDAELEVLPRSGDAFREAYTALSGATYRTGSLMLHAAAGAVRLESAGLDRAWVTLVARACPIPEFARGLRTLGSRRSGDTADQFRFFAPLIQARRFLEEEADIERRLECFPAAPLADRLRTVIAALAAERFPRSGPDRRALEAELLDALASLFVRFDALSAAASRCREAPDAARFVAWRSWLDQVAGVFAEADTGWSAAARVLPPVPAVGTRRRRRRGTGAPVAFAVLSLGRLLVERWS